MLRFFGTSAASDHCHLQRRNGSVHHELIRPNHYRPRNVIRCCSTARGRNKDYYQVLGVTVHSTHQEIKEAYRKLQKQHHPDIAGYKGHDYTLLLNEAYKVLTRNLSRHDDGKSRAGLGSGYPRDGYSSWNGPLAVESCPVNCIHWVDSQELPVLEFLSRPQPKEGHGIFGGGWEQPRNVFAAAKNFAKRLQREEQELEREQSSRSHGDADCEAETEAQAGARRRAGEVKEHLRPSIDFGD
ncbi:hypothetical protein BAE44_0016815 [Dichanthelium oligosanthes]|uniref:J domain-containing protein n=1 Tax=Dichanthelium oligosanthes TaxID=888268 RepID=A0A1E5VAJ1_9POAL|nr:hypothetical protein BAE44_0016815 [Dichanthelium oligosanthes]